MSILSNKRESQTKLNDTIMFRLIQVSLMTFRLLLFA